MALTIIGRVHSVGNVISIASKSGGQPFLKREIVLDCTRFDPYTGERDKFENFPQFEFAGDKCSELDNVKAGDVVTISFDIQGSFYKGADGVEKNFTRVRGYKIEMKQGYATQKSEPQIASKAPEAQQEEDEEMPF